MTSMTFEKMEKVISNSMKIFFFNCLVHEKEKNIEEIRVDKEKGQGESLCTICPIIERATVLLGN